MSISTGFKNLSNPCQYWIEYSGKTGKFTFYKKNDKGGGENIEVDMSSFIVIDPSLFTISGYSEKLDTGVYANEGRDLDKDIITVKYRHNGRSDVIVSGIYKEIKEKVESLKGPGYTKSIYIVIPISAFKEQGDEWVLANLKAKGSSLNAWIEFTNNGGSKTFGKRMTGSSEVLAKKKGSNEYVEPIFFSGDEIPKGLLEIAMDEDRELQKYLSEYLQLGVPLENTQESEYNPEDENQETQHEQQSRQETRKEETREETKPVDDNSVDTDGWESYQPKGDKYPRLGKCTIEDLETMKGMLEDGEFTDQPVYHFVIRGLAEKKRDAKDAKPATKKPPF